MAVAVAVVAAVAVVSCAGRRGERGERGDMRMAEYYIVQRQLRIGPHGIRKPPPIPIVGTNIK